MYHLDLDRSREVQHNRPVTTDIKLHWHRLVEDLSGDDIVSIHSHEYSAHLLSLAWVVCLRQHWDVTIIGLEGIGRHCEVDSGVDLGLLRLLEDHDKIKIVESVSKRRFQKVVTARLITC